MTEKNKAGIMITLGHNSSALFFDGINKPIGYEEERLNGIKSFSGFPKLSLDKILKETSKKLLKNSTIFISHWFDVFNDCDFPEKYYNKVYIDNLVNKYNIKLVLLNENFTHHDAHMYSSLAFLNDAKDVSEDTKENMHFIVADGFGNNQEVLSVYYRGRNSSQPKLVDRLYGYNNSIGLLYQYATSFCGMKENQDEYKFLGYESKIQSVADLETIEMLKLSAVVFSSYYVDSMNTSNSIATSLSFSHINIGDLNIAKESMYDLFNAVYSDYLKFIHLNGYASDIENKNDLNESKRIVIGFYIQHVVEQVLSSLVDKYNIENVCLSGGCFYNVKLNNSILNKVNNICIIPVAGDQGAAIGMYEKFIGGFKFFDLCFGKRFNDLMPKIELDLFSYKSVYFCDNEDDYVKTVSDLLNENFIVNVLSDSMEFGPRALCNTSTLAKPTKENVDYINKLNKRNTVMPMAPVMLRSNASALFGIKNKLKNIIKSEEYMIVTLDFSDDAVKSGNYSGVIHKYPTEDIYSGRPQIVNDSDTRPIRRILNNVDSLCLINTSFNTHGTPILYSVSDATRDFRKQSFLDDESRNKLVILHDKNR